MPSLSIPTSNLLAREDGTTEAAASSVGGGCGGARGGLLRQRLHARGAPGDANAARLAAVVGASPRDGDGEERSAGGASPSLLDVRQRGREEVVLDRAEGHVLEAREVDVVVDHAVVVRAVEAALVAVRAGTVTSLERRRRSSRRRRLPADSRRPPRARSRSRTSTSRYSGGWITSLPRVVFDADLARRRKLSS